MAEFAGLGGLWIAAILVVTLAAGLLRGFSGFGSSLLLVPVLGLAMGPVAAVAIGTLLEALATLMLVPSSLAHTTRHRLATMGLSALIAIPVGHLALRELDPLLSNLAISAAVVAMAGLMWRGMSLPLPRGTAGETGAGVASGFLTGFGSIGGPPSCCTSSRGATRPCASART
ncbi:MAG: sulfite exporter TauE/SafE family protein [Burkholderiaceae bacterium]|nr:sulfite exporter TauE/SafE family protein [Burkholderiaceae bacterium]